MSGRPSWKSAKIGLFRPFSAFFALFRRARTALGKSRKRRKKAFFLRYPRICLNPHLLNPHLRHPKLLRHEMAEALQNPVFAFLGCQRTNVKTLLCDTLGLAECNDELQSWVCKIPWPFFRARHNPEPRSEV